MMAEKERYELKLEAGDSKRVERIREWLKNELGLDVPKSEAIRYAIRSFDTQYTRKQSNDRPT